MVSYYQSLLQKAAEYELGCAEASKSCTPQLIAPLPIPHRSPAGSFGQDASGFGSLSLQRYYFFLYIYFWGVLFFPKKKLRSINHALNIETGNKTILTAVI